MLGKIVGLVLAASQVAGADGPASPPNRLGDLVWFDTDRDGEQDPGEPGVPGVSVIVIDGNGKLAWIATTDRLGGYLVGNLPDGTFIVCFRASVRYRTTRPNATFDAMDSDAMPATGCTPPVNLGPDNRDNLDVDAGFTTASQ